MAFTIVETAGDVGHTVAKALIMAHAAATDLAVVVDPVVTLRNRTTYDLSFPICGEDGPVEVLVAHDRLAASESLVLTLTRPDGRVAGRRVVVEGRGLAGAAGEAGFAVDVARLTTQQRQDVEASGAIGEWRLAVLWQNAAKLGTAPSLRGAAVERMLDVSAVVRVASALRMRLETWTEKSKRWTTLGVRAEVTPRPGGADGDTCAYSVTGPERFCLRGVMENVGGSAFTAAFRLGVPGRYEVVATLVGQSREGGMFRRECRNEVYVTP